MIETIENNKYNEQKNIETKDSDGPPRPPAHTRQLNR